jgi:hypothetical protein
MLGPNEQRHVCIDARQIADGRICFLLQPQSSCRFSNDFPGDRHAHGTLNRRNRDGMIGARNLDLFAFLNSVPIAHLALLVKASNRHRREYSHLLWDERLFQAFMPPSTVRFAPVMYEESGPATKATTAATSSTRP